LADKIKLSSFSSGARSTNLAKLFLSELTVVTLINLVHIYGTFFDVSKGKEPLQIGVVI